jgi:hypothetical protein
MPKQSPSFTYTTIDPPGAIFALSVAINNAGDVLLGDRWRASALPSQSAGRTMFLTSAYALAAGLFRCQH